MTNQVRIPPQATEVEQNLLGSLLVDRESRYVLDIVTVDDFYNANHKIIFKAINTLHSEGKPVDLLTVSDYLRDREEGIEELYLADLTGYSTTSTHMEYYAEILRDKALKRKAILECSKIVSECYEGNMSAYSIIDGLNSVAVSIDSGNFKHSFTPTEIFEREKDKPKAERIYTGISKLDYGIYSSTGNVKGQVELTIADSSHGKTVYAEFLAKIFAKRGYKGLWFQLEDYDVNTATHFAKDIPEHMDNIIICDSLYDIEAIKREARVINKEAGLDFIVFDYVQNIECSKNSRSDQVEYISQQITRLAKDLNVKSHVLSQVTINYSTRTGWKQEPQYGDVRWSQQLKQDAHLITSVFRPSRVESLVEMDAMKNNKALDWNGERIPFDSVFVRQAKVRGGKQEYARLHLIHGDNGLRLFEPNL